MRTITAVLWLALCAPAFGQATVNFYLQDAFGRPLKLARVALQPVPNLYPATNNLGQITGDSLSFFISTNATATVTNVTAGTYRQITFGPSATTTNYLLIPTTTNTINARDWVTIYPTGIGFILYEEAGTVGGRILFEP